MLGRQRQAYILQRIRQDGAVRVADLMRELSVSDSTVRRDLEILHERNQVEKVHGGATATAGNALYEPGFAAKSTLQQGEKEAIAAAAAGLVSPGMAIAISAGTTTHAVARCLIDVAGLTVVTNSVRVADVFDDSGRPDQTIILTGGVRTPSDALVGPFAVASIRSVHVDAVFIGAHGMDLHSGFTSPNLMEAETNRALIEAGRRVVFVADSTKWGTVGLSSMARLEQADVLITDSGLNTVARDAVRARVGELILVSPRHVDAIVLAAVAVPARPAGVAGDVDRRGGTTAPSPSLVGPDPVRADG